LTPEFVIPLSLATWSLFPLPIPGTAFVVSPGPVDRDARPRKIGRMAWVRVPAEHHPVFLAALPKDKRVETLAMFGGVAAKVNGHVFAGLFGRSTMVLLPEPLRTQALALDGAAPFDPMGNGRVRSEKVMLPEALMSEPRVLREWIGRAFDEALKLAPKVSAKKAVAKKGPARRTAPK
jgi:TfoX/Sxy family transcriptional regulator of competence genes